jgi:hypothetical protein
MAQTLHNEYDGNEESLREARRWVQEQFDAGAKFECPCCDKGYTPLKRHLRPEWLALAKRILDDHGTNNLIHVGDTYPQVLAKMANDWQFLRHWGLMETRLHDGEEKTHSGYWSVTDSFDEFANGGSRQPEWKNIQRNSAIETSTNLKSFHDVMGQPWSFDLAVVLNVDQDTVNAYDWNREKRKRSRRKPPGNSAA